MPILFSLFTSLTDMIFNFEKTCRKTTFYGIKKVEIETNTSSYMLVYLQLSWCVKTELCSIFKVTLNRSSTTKRNECPNLQQ